ncbi:MAG: metalloregulator ArsR/SmtB family transcription factor [Alkalispirochaeta sp.]
MNVTGAHAINVHGSVPMHEVFQALSDPLRLTIFRVLDAAGTELCVAEIVDITRRPQYAVSRGLRQLYLVGLVQETRRGKLVYYAPAPHEWIRQIAPAVRVGVADDRDWPILRDRLRWRLDIRAGDNCVVTYRHTRREEEIVREKDRVLFVCVHNSARSQMAEEFLRRAAGDEFEVESAGLEPGELNPYVVRVLAEEGIDISGKRTRDVFDVYRSGKTFSYVVTVCSREAEEKCPIFPGPAVRINWPFTDPSAFGGTDEEIIRRTREVRDEIKTKIDEFVAAYHRRHEAGNEERHHHV